MLFFLTTTKVEVRNFPEVTSVSRETTRSTGVVVMSSTLKMANVVVASVGKGLSAEIKKLIGPAKVVNIEIDDKSGTEV